MPGTITETYQRFTAFGTFKNTINPGTASLAQTGKGVAEQVVTASSDVTEIAFTGVTTYGRGYLANLDDTADVTVYCSTAGSTTCLPVMTVKPTEYQAFRPFNGSRWWYSSTNGATPAMHVSLLEN